MSVIALLLAVVVAAWSVVGYMSTRNIEEPSYVVEKKTADYEIRRYETQLRAEVTLKGTYRDCLYDGFSHLAGFIFGDNTARTKINMTAPVISETSEKIAMTAPVLHEQQSDPNTHVIAFVMPKEYSLETLPAPNNEKVHIRRVEEQRLAVTKFRGYATEHAAARRIERLKKALARDGINTIGQPQVAQYNPPWTPPYMRRNEILIPLE